MLVDVRDACPQKGGRFGLGVAFEFYKAVDLTLDIGQKPEDAPDHFFLGFQIRIHICAGLGGDTAFVETVVVAVVTRHIIKGQVPVRRILFDGVSRLPFLFRCLLRFGQSGTAVLDVAVHFGIVKRVQNPNVCFRHAVLAGTEGDACSVVKTEGVGASVVVSCLSEFH